MTTYSAPTLDTDVAVIGAGPYGISMAVHLRRAGIRTQVFGEPMSFWRTMPTGMKLRSNLSATNMVEPVGPLSLKRFGEEIGQPITSPVPLEQFIAYGSWVQRNAVPDVDPRDVARLERDRGRFALELTDGDRLTARRVVVAGGISPFAFRPPGFDHLPGDRVSHTGDHQDLTAFAGRRVVVVGGGQSAFECAALMAEAGARAEVLARRRNITWLRKSAVKSRLGPLGPIVYAPTDVGPLWYSRLVATPDLFRRLSRGSQERIAYRSIRPACSHFVRVRLDHVTLSLGVTVIGARLRGQRVRLQCSDGCVRDVDHVMLGTGYRVDVAKYAFLGESVIGSLMRVSGYPVLSRGLESSVEGLHIVGAPAAWSFGPTLRFVSGSWYAGRAVAAGISHQSPGRSFASANRWKR